MHIPVLPLAAALWLIAAIFSGASSYALETSTTVSAGDPLAAGNSDPASSNDGGAIVAVAQDFSLAQPFSARYEIELDGKPMGYGEMQLTRLADIANRPDLKQFEVVFNSKATSGVASMARYESQEHASFVVQNNQVFPLTYRQNESMLFSKEFWQASFDWQQRSVSVSAGKELWEKNMDTQAVDSLSIYLLLASQAANDQPSFNLSMLKEKRLARYAWTMLPTETISGACGEFATTVYAGTVAGSNKTIRTWHAQEMHWLPVRIRKSRKDDSYFQLDLIAINWQDSPDLNCGDGFSSKG